MPAGPVLPYELTEPELLELSDERRGQDEGNQKGGDGRINDPEAEVPEDVEERELGMEWIEPEIQHRF
jgi:hypothetical protein